MVKPRFVAVTWEDAWADSTGEWTQENVHENHRPAIMQTVGWLLLESEAGVSIFNERDTVLGSYRGRTFVPGRMILKVEDFPVKRKPNRKKLTPLEAAHPRA